MKKIFTLFTLLGLASSTFIFSQKEEKFFKDNIEKEDKEILLTEERTQEIKKGGKKALNNMREAFEKAGNIIDKKVKSASAKACEGRWVFTNGDSLSIIECFEDSTMQFTCRQGMNVNFWRGTYTSTSSQIDFHIFIKETRSATAKASLSYEEVLKIDYSVSNDEKMTLTCSSFPNDFNGYDFRNPTVFVKK